jgi:hypothetical protein
MMRRGPLRPVVAIAGVAFLVASAVVLVSGTARPAAAGPVAHAGAASVDATWHVGASAGQYAGEEPGVMTHDGGFDPHAHALSSRPTYGIESGDSVRALVVEGANGKRHALVTNDHYLPQDLVNRRVAQLIATYAPGAGITRENLTVSASHSHSSPYYSTPSWGAWTFQDVFDIRYFEFIADRMARAVATAASSMKPVQMGAATVPLDDLKRHSYGPARADDGTPAGFPQNDNDRFLQVLRFDDISNPADPKLLATWVVLGLHPEMLDGNDLHSGEYVGQLLRIVDRERGGVTLFSQDDTGTSETSRDAQADAPEERWELSHKEYGQIRRAGRRAADAVESGLDDISASAVGLPAATSTQVLQPEADFPVLVKDLRFAPPGARLYPTVSSCRSEQAFDGRPGVPLVGLPTCRYDVGDVTIQGVDLLPPELRPNVTYDLLRQAGVPVQDNIGAPSYTGLEETLQVHMQAIRYGDVAITVCPCEQFTDQARNIRSRLDTTPGNFWSGFDWTANPSQPGFVAGANHRNDVLGGCTQQPDTTWRCANPSNPAEPITDLAFRRMKAQIWNDARGWDSPEHFADAENDPPDPDDILGNYTREELDAFMAPPRNPGGRMIVTVGMTNDYWGYIVTYREFQQGDHYRKALTGLGPHSSDFFATRLSRMAAELFGGPAVTLDAKDMAYEGEGAVEEARATTIGNAASTYVPLYEKLQPPDGGTAAITTQPAASVPRMSVAKLSWTGGSNYVDSPKPVVERCVSGAGATCTAWEPYGDRTAEVHQRVDLPKAPDLPLYAAGQFPWRWTAVFEPHDSDIVLPDLQGVRRTQTPAGTYRFVVDGNRRGLAGAVVPYHLESTPFEVTPWEGITVSDLRAEADGSVSFAVGPDYPYPAGASNTSPADDAPAIDLPDTWSDGTFGFMHGRDPGDDVKTYPGGDVEAFCFHCSFQPWADTSVVDSAVVTVQRADGARQAPATWDPEARRFRTAPGSVGAGGTAVVAAGGVVDTYGERNGTPSSAVDGIGPFDDTTPVVPEVAMPVALVVAAGLLLVLLVGRRRRALLGR